MLIEKISHSNIEILLDTIAQTTTLRDDAQFMMPGNKLSQVCSMVGIHVELKNVSTLELFYLKKMASKITIKDKKKTNYINERYGDMRQKLHELLVLNNEISNDKDINTTSTIMDSFLPIGCFKYGVDAYFSGSNILAITGIILPSTFPDIDKYGDEKYIEDCLSRAFAKSLYESMTSKLTIPDTVCDYMFNKGAYSYMDSAVVSLGYVLYPYGKLTFYGATQETLNDDIALLKSKSYMIASDDVELILGFNTTFSTYLDIYLNTDYIIDSEDFNPLLSKNKITALNNILTKYKSRILSGMDYLMLGKKDMIVSPSRANNNKGNVDLNVYNLIFNGTQIKYIVKVKLSKIDSFISKLDNAAIETSAIKKHIDAISGLISGMM